MEDLNEYELTPARMDRPLLSQSLERRRQFVEEFFQTGDLGMAYNAAIDNTASRGTARQRGRELMDEDEFVRSMMAVARKNVIASTTALLAEHVSILAELRDGARQDGKWAPAIAAEIARGKVLGLYDRSNVETQRDENVEEMTSAELQRFTASIMQLSSVERKNIARMLTEEVDHVEDDIEGELISISFGDEEED